MILKIALLQILIFLKNFSPNSYFILNFTDFKFSQAVLAYSINYIIQLDAEPLPISMHFENALVFIDIYFVKLAIPG
jgi:hypothetical protein